MSARSHPRWGHRNRADALPADLADALGVTTHGDLVDLLDSVAAQVIAEETGAARKAGARVTIVDNRARKPRLADG